MPSSRCSVPTQRKTGGACYFEVPDRTTLRHSLVRSPPLASETESENLTGISEGAKRVPAAQRHLKAPVIPVFRGASFEDRGISPRISVAAYVLRVKNLDGSVEFA